MDPMQSQIENFLNDYWIICATNGDVTLEWNRKKKFRVSVKGGEATENLEIDSAISLFEELTKKQNKIFKRKQFEKLFN